MTSILEVLERHEGFVSHAYQDHLGYWTIGIGRLIDKEKGGGISKDEAYYLLGNDLARIARALDHRFPEWRSLTPNRRLVIQSMAFQLGVEGLMNFRKTLDYIRAGNFSKAADEMLDSKWARQTPKRAEELAYMMKEDEIPWDQTPN